MASARERKPTERVTPHRKRTRGQSQRDTKLTHSRQNRAIQEMGAQEMLRSQPFLLEDFKERTLRERKSSPTHWIFLGKYRG